jgi:hypothetical protein
LAIQLRGLPGDLLQDITRLQKVDVVLKGGLAFKIPAR